MKKFFKITILFLVLIGVGGYAVWHFGTSFASEKIVETVTANLDDETLQEVKTYIHNDATLNELKNEAAATNPETLPFQTKEAATQVLIKKVGINRLLEIKQQAQSGSIDQAALLSEIENKLSEEELSALKYVIYKELYK